MVGGLVAALLAAGLLALVADHLRFARQRRRGILVRRTAETTLASKPIDPAWLLGGGPAQNEAPVTEAATLAANDDATVAVYLWQTTRARYRWEHASDEVVTVLDGEVFLADEGGRGAERHLGPGDVAFFPAGSRSVWRVPNRLRKVSTLVRPLPGPVASLWRWARSAKRLGRLVAALGAAALLPKAGRAGGTTT